MYVDTEEAPKLVFLARRRKYQDDPWLVLGNRFFQLDPLSDSIVCLCTGTQTFAEIARKTAEVNTMSLGDSLVAVGLVVAYLQAEGLIEWASKRGPSESVQ